MKVLALVPDAFGGAGGIAQYNRDFLTALAASDTVEEIVVLPRLAERTPTNEVPAGVRQLDPRPGRIGYVMKALATATREAPFDVVFCGHLFMAPLATEIARRSSARVWLQTHGVDAWDPPSRLAVRATRKFELVTCVSRYTRDRMLDSWLDVAPWRVRVLPNTVAEAYSPGPPRQDLRDRYGIGGRKVMLTVSRMSLADYYKGQWRVIAALPELIKRVPDVVYLVGGSGDGVPRLEAQVAQAGLQDRVRFIGRIADDEMVDHYRLADCFVMPSTKEGFGIVFLEAAACGAQVVGGRVDGSWDALREGRLGSAVDPDNQQELVAALVGALERGNGREGDAVAPFARQRFARHVDELAREIMRLPRAA